MNYRPPSYEEMQHMNDIALLGLVKRLKEYSHKPELDADMRLDMQIAAGIIDYVARSRDDYK